MSNEIGSKAARRSVELWLSEACLFPRLFSFSLGEEEGDDLRFAARRWTAIVGTLSDLIIRCRYRGALAAWVFLD